MKKTVALVLLALVWTVSVSLAAELKVGDKAPGLQTEGSDREGVSPGSSAIQR